MILFIDQMRDRFGVELLCRVLAHDDLAVRDRGGHIERELRSNPFLNGAARVRLG